MRITRETIELNTAMIWEFMKERVRLELFMAFYYFMNFFYMVSSTKSNPITRVSARVIRKLSSHRFLLLAPMLAKIISEGSGASRITIELLASPKHSPSWYPILWRKYKFLVC